MNRINPEHQNIQINLNSDDDAVHTSDYQSDSDLQFQFNRTIEIPPTYNLNLSLNQIELPHTFYTFDENIGLQVNYMNNIVQAGYPLSTIMEIPKGFYTVSSLKSLISKAMKASTNAILPPSWDNAFNPSTLKWTWTFAEGAAGIANFSFSWFPAQGGTFKNDTITMIQRFFGMTKEAGTLWTSSAGATQVITSTDVADTTRYHNVYVTCESFSTQSMDSNNMASESVLCKVPVNAPFGSIINYKGSIDDGYLYEMRSLNNIQLSLRDHRGKLIQLNGARFNISILLQFLTRQFSLLRDLPTALPAPTLQPSSFQTPAQDYIAHSKGTPSKVSKSKLKQRVKDILKKKRTKKAA